MRLLDATRFSQQWEVIFEKIFFVVDSGNQMIYVDRSFRIKLFEGSALTILSVSN
jgi:hypothetical protein